MTSTQPEWDDHYRRSETPWDTGEPSAELRRVMAEEKIQPCRAIDLGCGTGNNAIWLAQQGFDVTGVDISPLAIDRARTKAEEAGVTARFLCVDLLNPSADLGGPYDFFFDRGCYHAVRRIDVGRFLQTLERITAPGAMGLVLTGNAREPLGDKGPPVVTEEEIRSELGQLFDVVRLREFRFDVSDPKMGSPLAWSCLLRRKAEG